jgi:hypothetical protein
MYTIIFAGVRDGDHSQTLKVPEKELEKELNNMAGFVVTGIEGKNGQDAFDEFENMIRDEAH